MKAQTQHLSPSFGARFHNNAGSFDISLRIKSNEIQINPSFCWKWEKWGKDQRESDPTVSLSEPFPSLSLLWDVEYHTHTAHFPVECSSICHCKIKLFFWVFKILQLACFTLIQQAHPCHRSGYQAAKAKELRNSKHLKKKLTGNLI